MKKILVAFLLGTMPALAVLSQNNIGIGTTTPNASAVLDVSSTNRGLLPPRMTALQRNAITSPANGLLVYDSDSASLMIRSAGVWRKLNSTALGDLWRSNGNHIFNGNTGNVGIGISNPEGKLDVNTGNVLFRGYTLNYPQVPAPPPISGGGGRMMWYAEKAAFRAGHTGAGNYYWPEAQVFVGTLGQPNVWDQDSIGQYSFAAGASTLASGWGSVSLGYTNRATGFASTALGYSTQAIGRASTSLGDGTIANANGSLAMGTLNDTADNSIFNDPKPADRVFQIGNGYMTFDGPARSTSFSILRNGNVGIGVANPNLPLHFATQLGKKISLYRGASGDAGFGVWGSELRIHSDFDGAAITFGYDDLTNGFTERFRMASNGDLRFASDQQSIQFVSSTNTSNAPMMRMFASSTENPTRMVIAHSPGFPSWGLEFDDTLDIFHFRNSSERKVSINLNNGYLGIVVPNPQYPIDAVGRLRLRGTGNANNSPGIWFNGISTNSETAFVGMQSDSSIGMFSNINNVGWGLRMNTKNGFIGLGDVTANARLQFPNDINQRKLVLYETANNNHQFYGFGVTSSVLRYQTATSTDDHVFYAGTSATTSQELMRLKGNGFMGIGNSPDFRLDVSGRMRVRSGGDANNSAGIVFNNNNNSALQSFLGARADDEFGVYGYTGSAGWRFYINTTTGNGWMQGTLQQNSDARLKKDIEPLSNTLESLQQLSGYSYHWKDASNPEEQIGLLAQEIQKVYPQLVKENEQGTLSVNYSGMVPVLLEAIKEQQSQITELKKLITQLIKTSK